MPYSSVGGCCAEEIYFARLAWEYMKAGLVGMNERYKGHMMMPSLDAEVVAAVLVMDAVERS